MSVQRMGVLALLVVAGLTAAVTVATGVPSAATRSAPACQPEIGPVWGTEGDEISVTVVCSTGVTPAIGDIALVSAPAGAMFDETRSQLVWTPSLEQAATHVVDLVIGDEPVSFTIGVGDAWNLPDNVPPLEPARLTHESGLPVFHVVTDAEVSPERYTDARVVHLGHDYDLAAAKLRGSFSLRYEKDNFTLRFDPGDPFSDPSHPTLDGSLKLVLNGNFDDNSHIRNRLAFEVWNTMAPGHLQVGHASAVLYVNGRYTGLYTVTDQIGAEFLSDAGLDGGELYKATGHQADFTVSPAPLSERGLEQKVPDPDDQVVAAPSIFELYEFVDDSDATVFQRDLADRVVVDDFIDWFVLVGLLGAGDSTAKNAYIYLPPNQGPARVVPWDFNQSFGQDFLTRRSAPTHDLPGVVAEANHLFERLTDEPEFAAQVAERAGFVLAGVGSSESMDALIDTLGSEVALAAARDAERWGPAYRTESPWAERTDFTTFDEELEFIADWYRQRVGTASSDFAALKP